MERSRLLLLVALLAAACSKDADEAPAPANAAVPPPAGTGAAPVAPAPPVPVADPAPSAAELAAAEEFVRTLSEGLVAPDATVLVGAFDVAAIADAVFAGVSTGSRDLRDARAGFESGVTKSAEFLVRTWRDGDTKIKGVVVVDGVPVVRMRLVVDDAITFLDFHLRRDEEGRPRIVDVHNHAVGRGIVAEARSSSFLANLNKGFLERAFGIKGLTEGELRNYGDLVERFTAGDCRGALASFDALPASLKEQRSAFAMQLACLQRLGDDERYAAVLKAFVARNGDDASLNLMLVRLYYVEKSYDKAIACVDAIERTVGTDATLLALQSVLLQTKGDVPAARARLAEALALEPDSVYVHSKGLDVLLAAKDHAAVRDSMVFLEEHGGYAFRGNMTDPAWKDFIASPESARWR